MSCNERLLRQFIRGSMLVEKLTVAAGAGAEGEAKRGMTLPDYATERGMPPVKPIDFLTSILWLAGQPQSAYDLAMNLGGPKGIFNMEALWKTDVSFLGEETLKPLWDVLIDTLTRQTLPKSESWPSQFWSKVFGRTLSAVESVTPAAARPKAAAKKRGASFRSGALGRKLAGETNESLIYLTESAGDEEILSAFNSDISGISSMVSNLRSVSDVETGIKMLHRITGDTADYGDLSRVISDSGEIVDMDQILKNFVDRIVPELFSDFVRVMIKSIEDPAPGSPMANISPETRSAMVVAGNAFLSSL